MRVAVTVFVEVKVDTCVNVITGVWVSVLVGVRVTVGVIVRVGVTVLQPELPTIRRPHAFRLPISPALSSVTSKVQVPDEAWFIRLLSEPSGR